MASEQQVALSRHPHGGGSTHLNRTARQVVPAFLQKLYEMVNDPGNDDLIRWSDMGDSFLVLDHERFAREVLGRWFKHQNFSSFVRQLNMYGFHKIPHLQQGVLKSESDTEYWHFEHGNFHRGQPDLLCLIQRKKQATQGPDGEPAIDIRESAGMGIPPQGTNLTAGQLLDINSILNGIAAIKRHQATISADLNELKASNQHLWQEALAARERHKKHQDTINRILRFLAGVFGHTQTNAVHKDDGRNTPNGYAARRQNRLMIGDGGNLKAKEFNVMEIHDDDLDSHSQFARDVSPASSVNYPTIETPSTMPSPSVAPSEVFAPVARTQRPTPMSRASFSSSMSATTPTVEHPESTLANNGVTAPQPTYPSAQHTNVATRNTGVHTNNNSNRTTPSPNQLSTAAAAGRDDVALQSAFQQMLQSPAQVQRLISAFVQHPMYDDAGAGGTAAAAQQLMPFEPQYDYSRGYKDDGGAGEDVAVGNGNTGAAAAVNSHANGYVAPRSGQEMMATQQAAEMSMAQADALLESTARLQKTYRDAAEIDADVNALHTSINSLIESLGLDPGAIGPAGLPAPTHALEKFAGPGGARGAPAATMPPPPPPMSPDAGAGGADATSGMGAGASDFDFDAFLTEFSREGEHTADMEDLSDQLEGGHIDGGGGGGVAGGMSPRSEQLSAFLDEVTSPTESIVSAAMGIDSPELQAAHLVGRKRKPDTADIVDDGSMRSRGGNGSGVDAKASNNGSIGAKVKRKR